MRRQVAGVLAGAALVLSTLAGTSAVTVATAQPASAAVVIPPKTLPCRLFNICKEVRYCYWVKQVSSGPKPYKHCRTVRI